MRPRLLFVHDLKHPEYWQDGLWAALHVLSGEYDIYYHNIARDDLRMLEGIDPDMTIGWGGFNSNVDKYLRSFPHPKALCVAGYVFPPESKDNYDVLFVECEWASDFVGDHPHKIQAFGVNTAIFRPKLTVKVWDYLTVGAFATWKRQYLLTNKEGYRIAVGEIQSENAEESAEIIRTLMRGDVVCSGMVDPETLANLYNTSKCVYIPAQVEGGGERALMEARACGISVEIEDDNPKLAELLSGPILDHNHYAKQLKKGVELCLNRK